MTALRRACGHVGMCPQQVLAATLTLFQPEAADYAHNILMSSPSFESHICGYTTNQRREVSPVEQYTIDCEYLAYFMPQKN